MNSLSVWVSGILKEGEWFLTEKVEKRQFSGERQKIELIPSHNKKKRWGENTREAKCVPIATISDSCDSTLVWP